VALALTSANKKLEEFMTGLIRRNPGETEFHQAVREVSGTIIPFLDTRPEYREACVLERLTEPDRIVIFRVGWEDDEGNIRTNRGYRVQWNSAIGPYKGGLRFHKNVTLSILKFLAFEQTFKFRADVQEQPDGLADGRRQRGLGLQSERKIRAGDHALLPGFHD
jgi:glutamate dehydrogenase (NADP+)